MKKAIIILGLVFLVKNSFAQSGTVLLRSDTVLLDASESNRLMPAKIDSKVSVSERLLKSVKDKKFKAVDPYSGETIPADEIFNWHSSSDTVQVFDEQKQTYHYAVKKQPIQPDRLSRLRIYQDWWFDPTSGSIFSKIQAIELMLELRDQSGNFIGYRPFCRIYY